MSITKIDIFSSQFFFNLGSSQQIKKGTLIGALLTIAVFASIFSYFVYLTIQYFNNQIDPKYKSQNFITENNVEVDLTSDLVGFRFEYDVNKNILDLEAQQNKKYVVFMAFFNFQNSTYASMTPLSVIKCTNPQLDGYLCVDFSKVSNFTLNLSTNDNHKTALYVVTYGCLDIDGIKKTSPSNCASQDDINKIVNGQKASVRTKLLSSQFNTTSRQKQTSYRNNYMYTSDQQAIYVQYKLQKQITTVQQGFLIQSTSSYSSPFQYEQIYTVAGRNSSQKQGGVLPYCKFVISMDEIFYQITVQYPTYPEILALVNSALAILMTLGYLGRYIAQKFIKQEFFLLFLQNMYQDTYEQIMQVNNIFKINDKIYFEKKSHKKYVNEEFEAQKDYQKINIPFLKAKNNLFSSVLSPNFHNDKVLSIQANAKIEAEQQNLQTEQEKTEQLNTIITTQYEKAAFLDKQMTNMQKSNQIDSSQSPYSPGFAISPKFNLDCIDESQVQLANQQLINNLSQSSVQHKKKIRLSIATKTAQKLQNLKTDQNKKIEQSDNLELKKEVIEKLEDKEINQYFTKKLEVIQNQNVSKNIQSIIFGKRLWKKKEKDQADQQLDNPAKSLIESQVEKSLDILQLYRDIIFLKKAVMLILSKDQLATLHLVGCSPYFLSKEINQKAKDLSLSYQMRKRNYFEEQFAISLSQDLQKKYIQKFLEKCQNSNELSEIDCRILSSVVRNQIS